MCRCRGMIRVVSSHGERACQDECWSVGLSPTHKGAPAPLSTSHQALGPFRNTADGFLLKVVVLTESFLPFRAGALFSTDGDASPFVSLGSLSSAILLL